MTLIVGIKCTDGIVIGADGAATFGAMGQRTIRQTTSKLYMSSDCTIVGVSGPIGIGQRINGEIESLWNSKAFVDKTSVQAMTAIRLALWNNVLNMEYQVATVTKNLIGQIALESALASTVVALPLRGAPCLFQFDQQGAPEEASSGLPFVAIGSGQPIADPFLAFIRRIFWPDGLPTLNAGIFSTVWTLEHAIQTNPGGVSNPKQIVVLEKQGKNCRARELPSQELEEHLEATKAAESKLATFQQPDAEPAELEPPAP